MARVMIRSARQDPLFVIQTLPRGVCLPHRPPIAGRGTAERLPRAEDCADAWETLARFSHHVARRSA